MAKNYAVNEAIPEIILFECGGGGDGDGAELYAAAIHTMTLYKCFHLSRYLAYSG